MVDTPGKAALKPAMAAEWARMRSAEGWHEDDSWPMYLAGADDTRARG